MTGNLWVARCFRWQLFVKERGETSPLRIYIQPVSIVTLLHLWRERIETGNRTGEKKTKEEMMEWYYANGRQPTGPVSEETFHTLVNTGKVTDETLVWNQGMTDWQKYGKVNDGDLTLQDKMVCSECGTAFSQEDMIRFGNSWVCASCKPVLVQKLKEGVNVGSKMEYAGFWLRFGAKIIDGIIIGVINIIISLMIGMAMTPTVSSEDPTAFTSLWMVLQFLQVATAATYTTLLLGKYGATVGKMACRIKVVTANGERISYPRALGRHFAEILSALVLCIGYIMAAFDNEKRSLHDRICNTRVVRQ